MDIRQLSDTFFVSPQIDPSQMDAFKAAGITCILCNRPDAEVPPSHQAAAMKDAAEAAGLQFVQQPLTHQTMTPEVISHNASLADQAGGTVLAYCASGTRSTVAWCLAQAAHQDADALLASARAAGYDLEGLRPALLAARSAG